ncbi:ribosome maturation factor RimP [Vallicoccus soli]|uniref:Ribosome maturation factor RimP n=1 Tax=Vallicoccus soli TaxID=2339232 RepID=A0A3A3Z1T2_9ACTN|nr:ribosome maturation factor RimP [Vallicoccus soli]RJK96497.1 ribosome maturation factor RimP [Vallicoccus soli]
MPRGARTDDLRDLLEPVVAGSGLDLEELAVTPAGKRRVVRVVVDQDGGVSLDTVAEVSQRLSAALDAPEADRALGGAPYVLEVTSPGVDRPLTEARHWRRARTRLVVADLVEGGEVTGRVLAADDEGVDLEVDGEPRRYALADLRRGRVQVEFSRPGAGDEDEVDGLDGLGGALDGAAQDGTEG